MKYPDQPRTHSYDKSLLVYRPTHTASTPNASVVVCEGPLDALAIAAHAATAGPSSYFAPVAACGTALTGQQIDRILALHPDRPFSPPTATAPVGRPT